MVHPIKMIRRNRPKIRRGNSIWLFIVRYDFMLILPTNDQLSANSFSKLVTFVSIQTAQVND